MPGILALDQALCTGWAHCEPGEFPQWNHKIIARAGADHGEVIPAFYLFVCSLIENLTPKDVLFERPFLGVPNPQTILLLGALRALIILACEHYGVRWYDQDTRAAVKLLTGAGKFLGATKEERRKAKKAATIAACIARGWNVENDNEADALALLLFAESRLYPREAMSRQMIFKQPTGSLFT